MVAMSQQVIQLEQLFKLRLVIARLGERDNLDWWNTQGVLGADGAFVYQRGFPYTHRFAQARVVFAVAQSRCQETFAPPNSATLWQMPAPIEDQFEDRWQDWLDNSQQWQPFFDQVAAIQSHNVLATLRELAVIDERDVATAQRLKLSSEGRSVALSMQNNIDSTALRVLAAAFVHARPGQLVVPYLPLA
jgi:hypothetical protein